MSRALTLSRPLVQGDKLVHCFKCFAVYHASCGGLVSGLDQRFECKDCKLDREVTSQQSSNQ